MVHCLRNPQQTRDTFAIPQEEEYLFEIPAQLRNPRSASSDSTADCVTK
jgi:hypothetical protein